MMVLIDKTICIDTSEFVRVLYCVDNDYKLKRKGQEKAVIVNDQKKQKWFFSKLFKSNDVLEVPIPPKEVVPDIPVPPRTDYKVVLYYSVSEGGIQTYSWFDLTRDKAEKKVEEIFSQVSLATQMEAAGQILQEQNKTLIGENNEI
jgi:hypothetical protein